VRGREGKGGGETYHHRGRGSRRTWFACFPIFHAPRALPATPLVLLVPPLPCLPLLPPLPPGVSGPDVPPSGLPRSLPLPPLPPLVSPPPGVPLSSSSSSWIPKLEARVVFLARGDHRVAGSEKVL
jgi:hypothetical protein